MASLLIVDDEPTVLKSLRRVLALDGHDIVVRTSCDMLDSDERFDVAIVDIDLNTEIDGIECARRLVEQGRIDQVIFHSAMDDDDHRARTRLLGPFVAKGDLDRLRALIPKTSGTAVG